MKLPTSNDYIPEDLDMISTCASSRFYELTDKPDINKSNETDAFKTKECSL
jgi:hypothetical protein